MPRWPFLVLAFLALAVPAASAGKRPCSSRVVADWYDNGKLDHTYSCGCLQAALDSLPVDLARNDARDLIDSARKTACAPAVKTAAKVVPPPPKKQHRNLPALITSTVLAIVVFFLVLWRRRQKLRLTSRGGRTGHGRG